MDEEDLTKDEDYSYTCLKVPDPEDEDGYLVYLEIEASVESPSSFRDALTNRGFDHYKYAEENAYDFTKVGGIDCLKYERESYSEFDINYFNRIEGAGATVDIDISTVDAKDARIDELLKGLTFTLKDTGNEDGPWEWEGTPFSAEAHSVPAGSFTIDSQWIPFGEYISTNETFDHAVAVVDDTVYMLIAGALKEFSFDGKTLTLAKDIELPDEDYDTITADDDGNLWISGGMNDLVKVTDGSVSATFEELDTVTVHPSGKWGISYFTSAECQKVTFDGTSATTTPVTFAEADTIMHMCIDENYIYVCASAADESGHKVFVYDADGTLKYTLCDAEGEGLGSITFITSTENGFIGFDGNMRTVNLWDSDGKVIAEIEDSELFETSYPWFCYSDMMSDGSILTLMTEERADESATEIIAFIVKGF